MKRQLSEKEKNILKQLVLKNKKIEAIKYIRKITGFGLKESKKISDNFFNFPASIKNFTIKTLSQEPEIEESFHEHIVKSHELNNEELNFVKMLINKRQKIQAVKYVKERLATGLKEAKEYVDYLASKNYNKTYVESNTETNQKQNITDTSIIDKSDNAITEFKTSRPILTEEIVSKKEKSTNYESEPIIFQKSIERDKNKKRRRQQSNSGCMLMLTFMFIGVLLIVGILFI